MARANKYETHIKPYFEQIFGWLRSGHTEGSIAKRLGITDDTWTNYKKRYSDFSDTIKRGGQDSTALVVNKLYQRAMGYEFDEITTEIKNIDGKQHKIVKKTTKHIAPDVGAIAIVLFNRDPANWKNKQNIEHTIAASDSLQDKTIEELNKEIKLAEKIIANANKASSTNNNPKRPRKNQKSKKGTSKAKSSK